MQVKAYGSFVTGLALPSSDVDLVICLPKVRKDTPAEAPGALEGRNAIKETWQQELARRLRAMGTWIDPQSIKIIAHAAVPVIKVRTRDAPTGDDPPPPGGREVAAEAQQQQEEGGGWWRGGNGGVPMDISFEGGSHNGLAANAVVTALIAEMPALRPLTLVLKQFMSERGLLESYSGGLSAYGLVLLVACYLRHQPPASASADAGSLLLGFLDFYGQHFNPRTTGLSLTRPHCFFSREQQAAALPSAAPPLGPPSGPPAFYPSSSSCSVSSSTSHADPASTYHHRPASSPSGPSLHLSYRFDPLCIEDPIAPCNNVGRNCFRIAQIKRAFTEAWQTLHVCLHMNPPPRPTEEEEGEGGARARMPLLGHVLSCRALGAAHGAD